MDNSNPSNSASPASSMSESSLTRFSLEAERAEVARFERGRVLNGHYSREQYIAVRADFLKKRFANILQGHVKGYFVSYATEASASIFITSHEQISVQEARRREEHAEIGHLLPFPTTENEIPLPNGCAPGDNEWSPSLQAGFATPERESGASDAFGTDSSVTLRSASPVSAWLFTLPISDNEAVESTEKDNGESTIIPADEPNGVFDRNVLNRTTSSAPQSTAMSPCPGDHVAEGSAAGDAM